MNSNTDLKETEAKQAISKIQDRRKQIKDKTARLLEINDEPDGLLNNSPERIYALGCETAWDLEADKNQKYIAAEAIAYNKTLTNTMEYLDDLVHAGETRLRENIFLELSNNHPNAAFHFLSKPRLLKRILHGYKELDFEERLYLLATQRLGSAMLILHEKESYEFASPEKILKFYESEPQAQEQLKKIINLNFQKQWIKEKKDVSEKMKEETAVVPYHPNNLYIRFLRMFSRSNQSTTILSDGHLYVKERAGPAL